MTISPEQAQNVLNKNLETPTPSTVAAPSLGSSQAAGMLQAAGIPLEKPEVSGDQVAPIVSDGMLQSFGEGVVRGVKDLGQGLEQLRLNVGEKHPFIRGMAQTNPFLAPIAALIHKQTAGTSAAYSQKINKEIADYEKRTKEHPIASGVGRLVGNIVPSLPFGGIEDIAAIAGRPFLSKVLGGGLVGATYGGLSYDPAGGSGRAQRALVGGLIGAAIPSAWHGLKTTKRWLFNKPTLIDDPAVLKEAAKRVGEAQEVGIPRLTAGAATRDPVIQAQERRLLKLKTHAAQTFQEAYQNISQQIHKVGNAMIDKIGGKVMANRILGEDVQDALRSTKKLARNNISKMYEMAENAPGGMAPLDRNPIIHTAKDLLDNFTDLKFSPAIKKTLGKLSKAGKSIFITPIKQASSFASKFTLLEANKFIRTINKSIRGTTDPSHRLALSKLKSSVMDTIDGLADSVDNPSRSLFNMARQIRRQLADIYDQKDIVGTLLRRKGTTTDVINPEHVVDRIFGRRNNITDLTKVEKALKYELPFNKFASEVKASNPSATMNEIHEEYANKILPQQERSKRLWEDLKATKFNDVIQKSINTVNGIPVLSYKLLTKNIKQLGKESLDKIINNKEVSDKFHKLINVMDYFQNQAPTKATSDRAVKALQKLSGGIFGKLGGEETRFGAFIHKPIGILVDLLKNINDENWVKSNLHLGAKGKTLSDEVIKKDPAIIEKIREKLRGYPSVGVEAKGKTLSDEVIKKDPAIIEKIREKLRGYPSVGEGLRTAGVIAPVSTIEQPET